MSAPNAPLRTKKVVPSSKLVNNRFGSLNANDSGDDADEDFRRLMQQKKKEKEEKRKAEHEQLMLAKAKEEKKQAAATAVESVAPPPPTTKAAAAAAPSRSAKKEVHHKSVECPQPLVTKKTSPPPSPAVAAAPVSPSPLQRGGKDKNSGSDDDQNDVATTTPPTAASTTSGINNTEDEEMQLLDVLDKFNVAHSSNSIDDNNDAEVEEGEWCSSPSPSSSPAAAAAAAVSAAQVQQHHQREPEQEAAAAAAQFSDHGVLLSEQRKLDKEALTKQHFDYFLLLDFECACDQNPGFDLEIIEVPALLYCTKRLRVVAEFHTYCRPLRNPILTPFCMELTGITQDKVKDAPCYDDVVQQLLAWLKEALRKQQRKEDNRNAGRADEDDKGEDAANTDGNNTDSNGSNSNKNKNSTADDDDDDDDRNTSSSSSSSAKAKTVCIMTDGPCDMELFAYLFMHRRDGFAFPSLFSRYLDVKQTFRDEYGDGKFLKIREMLAKFGLTFQGSQHSGIDDTRNLGRIVTQMIRAGTVFSNVYFITATSGRQRVPSYLWGRAYDAVKRLKQRELIGIGPKLADDVRSGKGSSIYSANSSSRSSGVVSMADLSSIVGGFLSWLCKSWAMCSVEIRPGEISKAPSTPSLVLLLAVFVATLFL